MDEQRTPAPSPVDLSGSPEQLVTKDLRPEGSGPKRKIPAPGEVIGGYSIKDTIGEGGMGRVYLAHDPRLDRFVALKVLLASESDEEARARFLREARALARVDHENVVRVNASGVDDDIAWMSLEYIEGDPLDEVLGGGPIDEETSLLLAAQVARGLAAVHAVGVVHRDVKPGNLLIDDAGVLRVVDFGVALIGDGGSGFVTREGVAIGTPHFMAPEQARGGTVDARADAWGLGATLFMMLAGKPPFLLDDDESDLEILARVLKDKAPDIRDKAPGVSAETASLVKILLAPSADDRPEDLNDVADLLEACADHLSGRGPQPIIPVAAAAPLDDAASGPAGVAEAPADREASPPTKAASAPAVRLTSVLAVGALVAAAGGAGFLLAANESNPASQNDGTVSMSQPGEGRPPGEGPAGADLSSGTQGTEVVANTATPADSDPPEEPGDDVKQAASGADDPLAVPVPPPDELERLEVEQLLGQINSGDPKAATVGLRRLVRLKTDDAERAVYRLATAETSGARVIDVIGDAQARHQMRTLTWAVMQGSHQQSLRAIRALADIRNAKALELLQAAEEGHEDVHIREAAGRARRSLFSVEGEGR